MGDIGKLQLICNAMEKRIATMEKMRDFPLAQIDSLRRKYMKALDKLCKTTAASLDEVVDLVSDSEDDFEVATV